MNTRRLYNVYPMLSKTSVNFGQRSKVVVTTARVDWDASMLTVYNPLKCTAPDKVWFLGYVLDNFSYFPAKTCKVTLL